MIDPAPEKRAFPLRGTNRSKKWQIFVIVAQLAFLIVMGKIMYIAWQVMP